MAMHLADELYRFDRRTPILKQVYPPADAKTSQWGGSIVYFIDKKTPNI
jgi:hypothetical protein